MPTYENSVVIERPVFDVFKYVGDFENDPNWKNVRNVGITSGNPIRAGSMVAMTRPILGRKGFVNADVTEYERNKKIEMKGSFFWFSVCAHHHIRASGTANRRQRCIDNQYTLDDLV